MNGLTFRVPFFGVNESRFVGEDCSHVEDDFLHQLSSPGPTCLG
jgi:hypothetical protein